MKTRLKWGLGLGAAVLFILFVLPEEFIFLVALAGGLLGWREYARMMAIDHHKRLCTLGYCLVGVSFTATFFVTKDAFFWVWLSWVSAFVLLLVEESALFPKHPSSTKDPQKLWTEFCRFVMGNAYVFMIFGFIGPIVNLREGRWYLLLAFCVVFLGDSGALVAGRKWGKRKLWPTLSPGKTIEGAMGGFVTSILASLLVWGISQATKSHQISLLQCLGVGIIASPLAQAGDLIESLMKRAAGQKDSGTMVPGHGGILDRVDGLALVLPLIYFLF